MSFKERNPRSLFGDMLDAIDRITLYTDGMSLEVFQADAKTIDAVERCLQRLIEAAIRLGDDGPRYLPNQPWADIRGMGNWLRHAYDRIDTVILWNTIDEQLPRLRADLERIAQ